MSNETAVEAKIGTAAAQSEVVGSSTNESTEVDYEALLKQKDDELEQTRKEKENYRKGMLKAKGKIPDEDDNSSNEGEDIDSKVKRLVQEQILQTKEAQIQSERKALEVKLAKENKELKLALKNRAQVTSTSGQGSNQDKPEVKIDNVLSNEQLSSLKAKGWDDKKIEDFKKNLNKVNQMPK